MRIEEKCNYACNNAARQHPINVNENSQTKRSNSDNFLDDFKYSPPNKKSIFQTINLFILNYIAKNKKYIYGDFMVIFAGIWRKTRWLCGDLYRFDY